MDEFFTTEINTEEYGQQEAEQPQQYKDNEIWKKWIQNKNGGRFCTISVWPEGFKIIIDIGETSTDNKLDSNVKMYVDIAQIYTYLEAVKLGLAHSMFPIEHRNDKAHYDTFISYGGSKSKEGKPSSRILKIQTDMENREKYLWKGGIFNATISGPGAYKPIFSEKIAEASILLTRIDMANICNLIMLKGLGQQVG